MRAIGDLPDKATATTFSDALVASGIPNEIEPGEGGAWTVWVREEEAMTAAAAMLESFRADPNHPRFQGQSRRAAAVRAKERQDLEDLSRRVRSRKDIIASTGSYGIGTVCIFLLFVSAGVFLVTGGGKDPRSAATFLISLMDPRFGPLLPEVRSGEVWRLVTPIFLHFGFLHILFNGMWIISLGSLLEARRGSAWLVGFVIVNAVIPNFAQYWVHNSPWFGGLSGVVYAMAGYAWQRGSHDPGSGIGLAPNTVLWMSVYFVLCWLGEFDALGSVGAVVGIRNVANVVHTGGLVIGAVWGWWDATRGLSRRSD